MGDQASPAETSTAIAPTAAEPAAGGPPAPRVAYTAWIAACEQAGWRSQAQTECVPVAAGLGRVTAAEVVAEQPSPRFDCAAMDGIAVRTTAAVPRDANGNGSRSGPWRLAAGQFVWVDTGEPMPPGTDRVVRYERVNCTADGSAWITGPAARGLHVRACGEDFPAGQALFPAGHRLRPVDLAAAAAAGHATMQVVRRPTVAIIPTGDEIRPAGSALGTGEVTDSNSLMLAAQVTEAGGAPAVWPVQPDDRAVIAAAVEAAAAAADLVLLIAGSSGGHRDHAADVLAGAGGLVVRGVAVRPGHPVLLGYACPAATASRAVPSAVPVIGVPGYPLAAVVIFELFAAPLLAALQGSGPPDRPRERARLACDWRSAPDVEEWVPVSLTAPAAGPDALQAAIATPGRQGAGAISRIVRADAWWQIPAGPGVFSQGEHIDVLPIAGAPGP